MRALLLLAVIGLVLIPAQAFAAQVANAGFEDGLTGWSVAEGGDAAVTSSIGPLTAQEGTQFARLTTAGSSNQTYLDQPIDLLAGQAVSVQYCYFTNENRYEYTYNDFGYGWLLDGDGAVVGTLLYVNTWVPLTGYAPSYSWGTGWLTGSATAPYTGHYTLRFMISDQGDGSVESCLAIDDIQVSGTTTPVVVSTADDESDGDYSADDVSLREAIELANMHPDYTFVTFDIAPGGPKTISLTGPLPIIGEMMEFRGKSQPGLGPNDRVVVSGANLVDPTNGLTIAASNCLVEGLGFADFCRGIAVIGEGSTGNLFNDLYIFSQAGGMSIDLAEDGVTGNDAGDGDSGPNNRQNFPVLGWLSADRRSVSGTLNGAPNRTYLMHFYGSDMPALGGYGQMQRALGHLEVTTDDSGNASFTYSPPGPLTGPFVSAFAIDRTTNDSSELSASASVVVAGADVVVDEGDYASVELGDFIDFTSSGPWTMSLAFGDGYTDQQTLYGHGALGTYSHAYSEDGLYTVAVGVAGPTGSGADSIQVTVNNVVPSVNIGADRDALEGDPVAFSGDFYDPGVQDTHTYRWDFGDGATSTQRNPVHTYADPGAYTVTLAVTDDDGGVGTDTLTVAVNEPAKEPVFRFYNVTNGTHFYTASAAERDYVMATWKSVYVYEGVAYYTCTTRTTSPLYRLYNRLNRSHFYTASGDEATRAMMFWPEVFAYEGPAYSVRRAPVAGSTAIHRFYNKKNGSHFYTASAEEAELVKAKWPAVYEYEGTAFWVGQ